MSSGMQPSTELAVLAQGGGGELVRVPEGSLEKADRLVRKHVINATSETMVDEAGGILLQIFFVVSAVAAVSATSPFALIAVPFAVFSPLITANEIKERIETADIRAGRVRLDLYRDLRGAQIREYRQKQERLVALADAHLVRGGLLDEKTMSYIAVLPPDVLEGASDQLAITVLQARRLLACERAGRQYKALKPETFASAGLSSVSDRHRGALRKILSAAAPPLEEDRGPETWPEPDISLPGTRKIPAIENLRISNAEKALRVAVPFLFALMALRYRWKAAPVAADLPPLTASAEIPPLRAAADFSEALARYEREVERLDLPALRGWNGGRRLVSAPPALPAPLP